MELTFSFNIWYVKQLERTCFLVCVVIFVSKAQPSVLDFIPEQEPGYATSNLLTGIREIVAMEKISSKDVDSDSLNRHRELMHLLSYIAAHNMIRSASNSLSKDKVEMHDFSRPKQMSHFLKGLRRHAIDKYSPKPLSRKKRSAEDQSGNGVEDFDIEDEYEELLVQEELSSLDSKVSADISEGVYSKALQLLPVTEDDDEFEDLLIGKVKDMEGQAKENPIDLLAKYTDPNMLDGEMETTFHELSVRCLPVYYKLENGVHFDIKQDNTFHIECDKGKVAPLFTFFDWRCNASKLSQNYFTPTMCVDKKLPKLVTMSQKVSWVDLKNSQCGCDANITIVTNTWKKVVSKRGESFQVNGHRFTFDLNPIQGKARGVFENKNLFKLSVQVVFKVRHVPSEFELGNTTYNQVKAILANTIMDTVEILINKDVIETYKTDDAEPTFKASGCKEKGSAIQSDLKHFKSEIPSCRVCDRGMYLDVTTKLCLRCSRGWYSEGNGATMCTKCPNDNKQSTSGESLKECFAIAKCPMCTRDILKESSTVATIYNAFCIIVVAWNIRSALPVNKADVDNYTVASRHESKYSK